MTVLQFAAAMIWANVFQKLYGTIFPPRRMILVCGERPAFGLKEKINSRNDKYHISEMVNISRGMEYVYRRIQEYECVIIGDIPSQQRNEIEACFEKCIRTYMASQDADIILRGCDITCSIAASAGAEQWLYPQRFMSVCGSLSDR